ncbi:MAG: glycosyltransferase family 2 protein [Candidatus Omnitrophota bacterium]|jgi:glycosyltransferase involved in cell wall biosynthesis
MKTDISVVIPVHNEEKNLRPLYERLTASLAGGKKACEFIFVEDGSTDGSLKVLKEICRDDKRVKIVGLSRNFGHEIATTAGLRYSKGDAVIVMDADLQHPPEAIPGLIEKHEEGYDIVYALRRSRKAESKYKEVMSKLFYRVINRVIEIKLPHDLTDFMLLSRRAVKAVLQFSENVRFFRGMVSWVGYKSASIYYEEDKRYSGSSKYDLSKLIRLALDIITGYSIKPLTLVTYLGFTVFLVSLLLIIYYLAKTIIFGISFPGFASLMLTVLFIGGVQLLSVGIIGQYIGRIYTETQKRPLYLIDELTGIEEGGADQ